MAEIPKMKLKMCHPLCDCHQCQVIKDDLDFKLGQPTSLDDLLKIHNDHGYTGERDWKKFSSCYSFLHLTFPSHLPFIFFSSFSSLSFPLLPFSPLLSSFFTFFLSFFLFLYTLVFSLLTHFSSYFSSFSSFSFPSFPLTLPPPPLPPSSSSPHPPPTALHASCMLGHDDVTTWLLSNSSSAVKAKTLKQGAINRNYK